MVHRPKFIQSTVPYGGSRNTLVTTRVSDSCIITSEFWDESPRSLWKIGDVIIARKGYTWKTTWELGKHFVVTRFYASDGSLVGCYWDICSEVSLFHGSYVYEDWYLDVWLPVGGKAELLDESEFAEAVDLQYISLADADTAKWAAFKILELARSN